MAKLKTEIINKEKCDNLMKKITEDRKFYTYMHKVMINTHKEYNGLNKVIELDDFKSECFMKIYKSLDLYDENKATLKTFCVTCIKSTALQCLRISRAKKNLLLNSDFTISLEAEIYNTEGCEFNEILEGKDDEYFYGDFKENIMDIINTLLTPKEKQTLLLKMQGYKTIEIAKSYGANIYHYDWTNDFSDARNKSLEKATKDWILVLDADEVLPYEEGLKLGLSKEDIEDLPDMDNRMLALIIEEHPGCVSFIESVLEQNGKTLDIEGGVDELVDGIDDPYFDPDHGYEDVDGKKRALKELGYDYDEIKEAENTLGFNPASNPSCLKFVKQVIGPHMTSASKEALAEYYSIPEVALLGKAKQAKARAGLLVKMYDKKADGRIHSIFTQILSTARLASKEPNMQQIPRTVKAHIYRAPKGRTVFSADYPAIELRLASVWHKEPVMLEAFKNGEDLHYRMAQLMTGKKIPHTDEEKHDETGTFINKEERTAAKNVNFGYIYGSWWTSYQQIQLVKNHTKISDADAQKTRSDFMGLYKVICKNVECAKYRFKTGKPRVSKQIDSFGNEYTTQLPYMEEVCTLFGRRLAVETANTALNYGIQGSGGDACKLAVCIFDEIVKKENIDAYIVNLIHDDIVVESSIEDKERAHKALATAMNTAADCMMGCYFNTDVSEEIETLAETPIEN